MATASPGMTLSEMSCKITNSFAPGEPFAAFSFSWTTFESPVARTMGWEKSGMRSILFGALLACCGTAAAAPTILVYGDSLSSAYGIPQSAGWVALLGERLKQLKSNYTVVNASVSGETSAGGAARIGRVLASTRPAIVIVELGANDGLRGLPVAQMKANLTAIVRAAKRQGARERDALLLPSGKGLRVVPQALPEAHACEHLLREVRRPRLARELQRQHHVLQCIQRREQLERLKHEAEQPRAERRATVLVQTEEIRALEPHLT